jgi:hypothetical protein
VNKPGVLFRKYPELGTLKVGESIIVPKPQGPAKYQHNFYTKAKRYGIRISVSTLDGERVRLTRIRDEGRRRITRKTLLGPDSGK